MDQIEKALGLGVPATQLLFGQIVLRAAIVIVATVAMIRVAGRRFIAQRNPVDVMLAFILGSMLARDINGNSAFWGTLGAGFFISILYRFITFWASKSDGIGRIIKGEPQVLVENGKISMPAMSRHQISHNDLMEDLRLVGHVEDVDQVRLAKIERSGEISVLRKPQILTVHIADGVQTVQIQII